MYVLIVLKCQTGRQFNQKEQCFYLISTKKYIENHRLYQTLKSQTFTFNQIRTIMPQQTGQQEWGLVYYRKKSQFNEYTQLKTKSFQYQKTLGKMYFTAAQDNESSKKQLSKLIRGLDAISQQLKSIFSQIYQQMRFLKLSSIASLIESFQQLLSSIHHYTIESFNSRLQYNHIHKDNDQQLNELNTCQKCMGSIQQLNLKRLYDEITTTSTLQQDGANKMTKEQRKKMIGELDEYDILVAEKQNYLRKVNAVLENKGRVGELSSHDKTYNFLSEYLSKLEKIQERRAKSINKSNPIIEQQDRKWQQQSYKHILQYIKRVLFEHFFNQCSGPVKKMFQKINLDKIFKSFGDNASNMRLPANMQNHETQTVGIPQIQQVKVLQKKMQFKLKQTAMLKANKDELEKKYMSTLDLKRKVEGDMFELKRDRKWLESEAKIAQEGLKALTEKYNQSVKNFQEDQRRTIQKYINQRQRIIKASRLAENQYKIIEEQHRKCLQTRNKPKQLSTQQAQTQLQLDASESNNHVQEQSFSHAQMMKLQGKRRKSKFNKIMFTALKDKKNIPLNKEGIPMFQAWQKKDTRSYHNSQEDSLMTESIKAECNLEIQQNVINVNIIYSSFQQLPQQKNQLNGKKTHNTSQNQLSKPKTGRHQTTQQLFSKKQKPQRTFTQGNQEGNLTNSDNDRGIKQIRNSIKPQVFNQNQYSNNKLSNFIIHTEGDQLCKKNVTRNITLTDEINGMDLSSQQRRQPSSQEMRGQMASERLYSKRKRHQTKQLPLQRVVQNGKQRFYIKKISRKSINFKKEKERIKEISQILKPYVYNNNNANDGVKGRQSKRRLKTIRQRLSELSEKKIPADDQQEKEEKEVQQSLKKNEVQRNSQQQITITPPLIGNNILSVQHIIESQYAYLKAVGLIDFLLKIGKENKKMVKAINKIQNQVKHKFTAPSKNDLQLFGGMDQAKHYIRGDNFWNIDNMKENLMIYNKNDGLSIKVQKYFTLLKRANPELYGVLMRFLLDPIFAVFGKKVTARSEMKIDDDGNFVRELFNQLQKYHKIKHNECTHIVDFLEKIGFYKYTYF